MRKIAIDDELRIGFPGRDASFAEGVEIGMLATLMSFGLTEFARSIAPASLEQARSLAGKLGYRVAEAEEDGVNSIRLVLTNRPQRPNLRLVSG